MIIEQLPILLLTVSDTQLPDSFFCHIPPSQKLSRTQKLFHRILNSSNNHTAYKTANY